MMCLDKTQEVLGTKSKVDKWDCIKLKTCTAKETIYRVKRQPMEWDKKHLQNIPVVSNKYSEYLRFSNNTIARTQITQLKNRQKT
jgi:hypothetical protein